MGKCSTHVSFTQPSSHTSLPTAGPSSSRATPSDEAVLTLADPLCAQPSDAGAAMAAELAAGGERAQARLAPLPTCTIVAIAWFLSGLAAACWLWGAFLHSGSLCLPLHCHCWRSLEMWRGWVSHYSEQARRCGCPGAACAMPRTTPLRATHVQQQHVLWAGRG